MGFNLRDISAAVSAAITTASPSVVGVGRSGSGVVVGKGLVLTNAHNLRGDLTVTFADGRSEQASVAGADVEGDLAVLTVSTESVVALDWSAEEPAAHLGDLVIGLSRPGGRALRAGVGFVAGLGVAFRGPEGRNIGGAIEHSALLPPGSSGGPLLDSDGRLLGINTHRPGEGTYLALPAGPQLKAQVDALAQGQPPRRARLGVALAPPEVARRLRMAVGLPERDGLLVYDVDASGPAGRSGVRRGDLIVSVGGQTVATFDHLAATLAQLDEGAQLGLVVVRGVEEVHLTVQFGERPSPGPEEGTA